MRKTTVTGAGFRDDLTFLNRAAVKKEVRLQLMGDPDAVAAATALLEAVMGASFEVVGRARHNRHRLCQYGIIRLEGAPPATKETKLSPMPAEEGLVRLTVRSVNEWRPLVHVARAEEAARAISDLDFFRAQFVATPVQGPVRQYDAARRAMRRLLREAALNTEDHETAIMLSCFGFKPWSDW